MITHGAATDSDIVRGRIAVDRAMKEACNLTRQNEMGKWLGSNIDWRSVQAI